MSSNTRRDFYDDYCADDIPTHPKSSTLPKSTPTPHIPATHLVGSAAASQASLDLLESLHHSTIGNYDIITTPFGDRKITYADYTASGRALHHIEDYLQEEVLPLYANTHTSSNTTGLQTTLYRHEARDLIRRSCRGSLTEDTVLFCGSGATAAVNTAINALHLAEIVQNCIQHNLPKPVVLVGPYEHHSNILPWKDTGAILITIPERFASPVVIQKTLLFNPDIVHNTLDISTTSIITTETMNDGEDNKTNNNNNAASTIIIDDTEQQSGWISQSYLKAILSILHHEYHAPLLVTSFSVASNVTGKVEDTLTLTAIAKSFGAITAWDYASCASVAKIDMNPYNLEHFKKDIIFFSPHKFLGGVGTPGVLIIKNYILSQNSSPAVNTGGGTVFFSGPQSHVYLNNFHEREEAGTPDIVGSIRCGLIMQLKDQLGELPQKRANFLSKTVLNILTKHPFIHVLDHDVILNYQTLPQLNKNPHTGVLSLIVYATPLGQDHSSNTNNRVILPSQFVSAVLNDLFGIQSRNGCLCAGPYAHNLLGISDRNSQEILHRLYNKEEDIRPGVVRVSLHYSMPLYEVEYILKALLWTATHGIKLMPLYKCVISSGEWKHASRRTKEDGRRWLNNNVFSPYYGIQCTSKRKTVQSVLNLSPPSASYNENDNNDRYGGDMMKQHCYDLMQYERLLLSGYLNYAQVLVENIPCLYNFTNFLNNNTTVPLQDSQMLFILNTFAVSQLQQLSTNHTVQNVGTPFSQLLPSHQRGVETDFAYINSFFNNSLPHLEQLLPNQYPTHPNNHTNIIWFPTPDAVLANLTQSVYHDSTNPTTTMNADEFLHTTSPLLHMLLLTQLATTEGVCIPAQQSHPGTHCNANNLMIMKQYILNNYHAMIQSNHTTPFFVTPPSTFNTTSLISTYPPRKPLWSTTINTVNALNEQQQQTLCIHCWHHHPFTPGTQQPRECVSCECVQFKSYQSFSTKNNVKTIATVKAIVPTPGQTTTTPANRSTVVHQQQLVDVTPSKKQQKATYKRIIGKTLSEAMIDFSMVKEGDCVLVGVSGGKDSLTLIQALLEVQKTVPFKFSIAAATVDPMTADYDPSPLKDYFATLNIPYFFESVPIMAKATELQNGNLKFSICSFCSRMRRGVLYSLCRKNGYNVLALGQHLDDFAESFIMSAFHNGSLNTMKPNYVNNKGDIRIIRPLCYTRESKTREYAKLLHLPIISENCPACFEAPKERARIKLMLAAQETIHPFLYTRLLSTMKPLMIMGMEQSVEGKATALIKMLKGVKGDDEEEEIAGNTDNNVIDELKQKEKEKVIVVATKSMNTIPSHFKVNDTFAPLTAETTSGLDIDIMNILDQDAQSGDEECKECTDLGGGIMVCLPKKNNNNKRFRPNLTQEQSSDTEQ